MSRAAAELVLALAGAYAAAGLAIGFAFRFRGVDPAARGAHAFRPLLLPGLVLLWPLMPWRWRQRSLG